MAQEPGWAILHQSMSTSKIYLFMILFYSCKHKDSSIKRTTNKTDLKINE